MPGLKKMHDSEYQRMFEAEDGLWWYVALRELLEAEVKRFQDSRGGGALTLLDAGCGTGANLQMLARFGRAFGLDLSPIALGLARKRRLPHLVRASVECLPFASQSFDLVLLADVIYHAWVRDEQALLKELRRVLRPGGVLLVHSAALECLRGEHDQVVYTKKRYRLEELRASLAQAGFSCERAFYRNALLLPLLYLRRRLQNHSQARSDVQMPPPWLNSALLAISRTENRLLAKVNFPVGSSIYCLARRSPNNR